MVRFSLSTYPEYCRRTARCWWETVGCCSVVLSRFPRSTDAGHPTERRTVMQLPARPVSRRGLLKGAAIAAGTAAAGIGATGTAAAADASVTATSPDGSTTITMSLTGGALSWSAERGGAVVVDASALGLKLSDGTMLGR